MFIGKLTTHVLDTAHGVPASALTIDLFEINDKKWRHVQTVIINNDGRTDGEKLIVTEFETIDSLGYLDQQAILQAH